MSNENWRPAWEVGVDPKKRPARGRRKKVTDRRHDWSEPQVFDKLEAIFPGPAHVRLPGVRNDTGKTAGSRSIDALVASVYPSRGLWLAGIEIKITRSDWRKELREPEKAEAILKYVDYFYMACPTGVINVGEIPQNWGLIEVRRDGAAVTKPATKLTPKGYDLPFILSIMRKVVNASEDASDDINQEGCPEPVE
jgi:hypothetical protein